VAHQVEEVAHLDPRAVVALDAGVATVDRQSWPDGAHEKVGPADARRPEALQVAAEFGFNVFQVADGWTQYLSINNFVLCGTG